MGFSTYPFHNNSVFTSLVLNLSFGGPIPVTNLNEYLLAICLLAKKFIQRENLSIPFVYELFNENKSSWISVGK